MRITFTVLVVLLFTLPASAQDPDQGPIYSWSLEKIRAHREKARGKIRVRLEKWLEARRTILIECPTCEASGRVADPRRVSGQADCSKCRGTGRVWNEEFDPTSLDKLQDGSGSEEHLKSRKRHWSRMRDDPRAAARIAISEYEIADIRVEGVTAWAMVKVRPVTLQGTREESSAWRPDVTFWHTFWGDWRVRDPESHACPPDIGPGGFYHPAAREKPTHDPRARSLVARAAELILRFPSTGADRVPLTVRVRSPGVKREKAFTVRSLSAYLVSEKRSVFQKRRSPEARFLSKLVQRSLQVLPTRRILPSHKDYHLTMKDGTTDTVVMTGFSPAVFMETVTIRFSDHGLPVTVTRNLADRTVRLAPRFERSGNRYRLAGVERRDGDEVEDFAISWSGSRRLSLPEKIEVRREEGVYRLRVEPTGGAASRGL